LQLQQILEFSSLWFTCAPVKAQEPDRTVNRFLETFDPSQPYTQNQATGFLFITKQLESAPSLPANQVGAVIFDWSFLIWVVRPN